MIVIINYGIGNLTSVKNMLKKAGARDVVISGDKIDIERSDKLILPGVGHFDFGMKKLKESGLISIIEKKVILENIPILGICLGAQLITHSSDEGKEKGLGWVEGTTVKFNSNMIGGNLKIPHMGWNYVKSKKDVKLWSNMPDNSRFYFVHSYHMKMNNKEDEWLMATYGYEFCAAFQKDNIYGCQFHPEKSHKFGLQLMKNFVDL